MISAPNSSEYDPAFLTIALERRGSRVASIYSWIPSKRTARPSVMFLVSYLIQCFWFMLIGDKLSP